MTCEICDAAMVTTIERSMVANDALIYSECKPCKVRLFIDRIVKFFQG